MFGKIVGTALLVVLGVIFAAIGTVTHQLSVTIWFPVPWGLVLALIAVAALFVGLRLINQSRVAALAAAIGAVGATSVLSLRSVGGSVLIPNNAAGVTWVIGPIIIAVVAIAWPRRSGRRHSADGQPDSVGERPESVTLPA